MSATENRIVRIVAWSFIVVILYGTISLSLLAFSMIEINRGVAHKDFVLKTYRDTSITKGGATSTRADGSGWSLTGIFCTSRNRGDSHSTILNTERS